MYSASWQKNQKLFEIINGHALQIHKPSSIRKFAPKVWRQVFCSSKHRKSDDSFKSLHVKVSHLFHNGSLSHSPGTTKISVWNIAVSILTDTTYHETQSYFESPTWLEGRHRWQPQEVPARARLGCPRMPLEMLRLMEIDGDGVEWGNCSSMHAWKA